MFGNVWSVMFSKLKMNQRPVQQQEQQVYSNSKPRKLLLVNSVISSVNVIGSVECY